MSDDTHYEEGAEEETPAEEASPEIDEDKLKRLIRDMRDQQNFGLGLAAGLVAAAVGAAAWAVITAVTNYQIGLMAVGVGLLVGYAVRIFGKGIDKAFGILGAVLSLLGCLAGNLLSVCIVIANKDSASFLSIITQLTPTVIVEILAATFHLMDILFYAIAVYEAYRFSFRRLTEAEVLGTIKGEG